MSQLVRPAPACSKEFLARPNTYKLKLPTGSNFYFSIPFNMDWLRPLRPIELTVLHEYLSNILGDVKNTIGHIGMYSVLDAQYAISTRLSCHDQLTEIENRVWAAGYGFPILDYFHRLKTFFWDWNTIHFECGPSVVAWYVRRLYDFQHKPAFERYAVRRSMRYEENKIGYDWWIENGQVIIKWYCNKEMVCVKTHGAAFRDLDEWKALKTQLESWELGMLNKGTARLYNARNGGWKLAVYSKEPSSRTSSDTSSFEHAYEAYTSTANSYFHESQSPEELITSNSNPGNRCSCHQATSLSPREHPAKHIEELYKSTSQTSSPSHPEPLHPSDLLQQANALAKTVKTLEDQIFHLNKPLPSSPHPPQSLVYPRPCLHHTTPPSTPQHPAQTAIIFPITTLRETSTPTNQAYQAYAEDDNDDDDENDSTEASLRAVPNSWRDV